MKGLITEEIAHIRGIPRKLIIFLHGYIDNCECLNHRLDSFVESFDNTAVHLPEAPLLCEIHEGKRQWFSMHRFDPDDERKTVPSLDECLAFYERMTPGFEESSGYLNRYIDNCLDLYGLAPEDLYLCGFSQGAMLAIYTALRREENIGGCVSFSGLLTTSRFFEKKKHGTPPMLLIHGTADNLVRFGVRDDTAEKLRRYGCPVETYTVPDGQHRITEDGLIKAREFINRRFTEKAAS